MPQKKAASCKLSLWSFNLQVKPVKQTKFQLLLANCDHKVAHSSWCLRLDTFTATTTLVGSQDFLSNLNLF